MILFKNARVVSPLSVQEAQVLVAGGKIQAVEGRMDPPEKAAVVDARGLYLSPGFIDIHVHGGGGYGVMDGEVEAVIKMCNAHAAHGTTSLLPTTLAAPIPQLTRAVRAVRGAAGKSDANILGVHLEGPFLSPAQRGAQSVDSILPARREYAEELLDAWDGIRMMGAAPEAEGGIELGRMLQSRGVTASIAHSDASYDCVLRAIEAGYSDVTHIYSGCSSVTRQNGYRTAGVVEAGLLQDELTVQVIADLKHLPVALLKLICKNKGPSKISLITDALEFAAAPLEEGATYTQKNGVPVLYEDGVMKLTDRQGFAGSVATMRGLVYNMVRHVGVPLADAVRMASLTPASCIGMGRQKGMVAPGFDADILLFDSQIDVQLCMVSGNILFSHL